MDSSTQTLIWLVLFLPVIGSMVQAFFGGKVVAALGPAAGKKIMGGLATLFIAVPFAIAVFLTTKLIAMPVGERSSITTLFNWIDILSIKIPFEVVMDPLSMTMVLIITGIGSLIHLYATGYMAEEKDYTRFFTYLNLFISSMLILVLGNNLALMFIGWEGVGLCSYLLIGFWYKDTANAKAANKAFIVNRIGDWGLTLGMFGLMMLLIKNMDPTVVGNRFLSYDVINMAGDIFAKNPIWTTAIALLLFVGACGKSAQFPLYLWLPDAMAGPTPVSALIHAATMVTAGVFMLNRLNLVFVHSEVASSIIVMTGAFTAIFAALIAFGQTDIKKVLAYSTVSQLGFMFIGCGVGAYWTGMFHVTTHAFFKALLFLGSGAVIHAMAHDQDMRNYGNLRKYLPITSTTMIIGWLAIAGVSVGAVFGFAGFYSKESILGAALAGEFAVVNGVNYGVIAGWIGLVTALLTSAYMTRMTYLTFFGKEERWRLIPASEHHEHDEHHAHEDHAAHAQHAHHEDHGPDVHGFFYTDEEMAAKHAYHEHEHHHALDSSHRPHEVPFSMWFPLAVLAVLSIVGGYGLYAIKALKFEKWLYPEGVAKLGEVEYHPHHVPLVLLGSIAAFGGIALGWIYYGVIKQGKLPVAEGWNLTKWSPFRRAAMKQFGYDSTMVNAAVQGGGNLAEFLWKRVDVAIIDRIVNGVGVVGQGFGKLFGSIQTGYARTYALVMLIGTAALLGSILWQAVQYNDKMKVGDLPTARPLEGREGGVR
jgi:NADH-quinone oxidoreductase subunit L